ncbi:MAG TPA: bifunctional UDP-sugar hydrolase/5'-nucleotidase [Polyangiales bacterium]
MWLWACAGAPHAQSRRAAVTPAAVSSPSRQLTLSIVTTNDVHGHLEQLPLLGGYLRNLRSARARDGAVLLLDAGDSFQGTLESNLGEGAAMVRGYNALGYAAAAIGNHEFDFGPVGPQPLALTPADAPLGALSARLEQSHFPWLSANLRDVRGGAFPIAKVQRSLLLQVAGVRVGIVGGLTMDALSQTAAPNVAGLSLAPLEQNIADEARLLREHGAQLVIALVHVGGECYDCRNPDDLSSCDADSELFRLARALPSKLVDVIVGGHTHELIAHRVAAIPVLEAGANGRAFGRIDLELALDGDRARVLAQHIFQPRRLCLEQLDTPACTVESYEGVRVERDPAVLAAITADFEAARALRVSPLGVQVVSEVTRASRVESPLANLVADLMLRAFPHADAALNNSGAVRAALPVGPLTYGQVFEMFPFDNALATLRIDAGTLARIVASNLRGTHGILALSGLRAEARCVDTQLVVRLFRPSGEPLADDTPLLVVTSDFLAARGEGLLTGAVDDEKAVTIHRDRQMREALLDGLKAYPGARIDGRARALFDPAEPRIRYPGTRPVACPAAAPSASAPP